MLSYVDRKGIPNPLGECNNKLPGGPGSTVPPMYNPDPLYIPPPNYFPPNGGMPPGMPPGPGAGGMSHPHDG